MPGHCIPLISIFSCAILLSLFSSRVQGLYARRICNVPDYVAAASTPFNVQVAIQKAFDDCSDGGIIYFPPDCPVYSTGPVVVKGQGVRVLGSMRLVFPDGLFNKTATGKYTYEELFKGPQSEWYLFRFEKCTNCSLHGGVLYGNSAQFVADHIPGRKLVRNFQHPSCIKSEECRPRLFGIMNSNNITVHDLRLEDPVYWSLHVIVSRKVYLDSIHIETDRDIPNTDGVDIDSAEDIIVSNIYIDAADDAICIKTTRHGMPARRIKVSSCLLRSRSCAIKIGSESVENTSEVTFSDIVVEKATRGAAIQLRDGGFVTNISFRNIHMAAVEYTSPDSWWGAAEPISLTATPRYHHSSTIGRITNVHFDNITARAENGILIAGDTSSMIQNISMHNIHLNMKKMTMYPGGAQDYRPSARGVEYTGKAAALWVDHAVGVFVEGFTGGFEGPRRPEWIGAVHKGPEVQGLELNDWNFDDGGLGMRGGQDEKLGTSDGALL